MNTNKAKYNQGYGNGRFEPTKKATTSTTFSDGFSFSEEATWNIKPWTPLAGTTCPASQRNRMHTKVLFSHATTWKSSNYKQNCRSHNTDVFLRWKLYWSPSHHLTNRRQKAKTEVHFSKTFENRVIHSPQYPAHHYCSVLFSSVIAHLTYQNTPLRRTRDSKRLNHQYSSNHQSEITLCH